MFKQIFLKGAGIKVYCSTLFTKGKFRVEADSFTTLSLFILQVRLNASIV